MVVAAKRADAEPQFSVEFIDDGLVRVDLFGIILDIGYDIDGDTVSLYDADALDEMAHDEVVAEIRRHERQLEIEHGELCAWMRRIVRRPIVSEPDVLRSEK